MACQSASDGEMHRQQLERSDLTHLHADLATIVLRE